MTAPGLCGVCRHARVIESRRGSRFWLCSLSFHDARFARYPGLPVMRCAGHEPGDPQRSRTQGETEND